MDNRLATPKISKLAFVIASALIASSAHGAVKTITFDDLINGDTSYLYDADNDGMADVIFSTGDPSGFNTAGPGEQQLFVLEPGLEGTTTLTPDLRIDLLRGGTDFISFGFATIDQFPGVVQVFDADNNQIGNDVFAGDFFDLDDTSGNTFCDEYGGNCSGFPEGSVNVPFDGTAAYVTIDFDNDLDGYGGGRYIIDNFTFSEAGDDILDLFEGGDPEFPVLPDPFDPDNPEFRFELDIIEDGLGTRFPIFIDPIIAVGYEYTVTSGSNVDSILIPGPLPNGDTEFTLDLGSNGMFDLFAGVTFDLEADGGILGGVSTFRILDIDTSEALDPADPLAFNTGLTFVSGGQISITQTPIVIDTTPDPNPNPVPAPGSVALLFTGISLLYLRRLNNNRKPAGL